MLTNGRLFIDNYRIYIGGPIYGMIIVLSSHRKHGKHRNGWVACGEKSYKFSPNLTELLFKGPAEKTEMAEILFEPKGDNYRNNEFLSYSTLQQE